MSKTKPGASRLKNRGRQATDPREIPARGWKDVLWRVYNGINENRVMLTAAGVTYYLLLALVPTLSAFVSIYGLFTDRVNVIEQVNLLVGIVPAGGLDIIREQLNRIVSQGDSTLGLTLLFSLLLALWSSSAGIKALFEAMNIAYGEKEKRNFFMLNVIAMGFTLGAAFAAVLLLAVIVIIPGVLAFLRIDAGIEWLVRGLGYLALLVVLVGGLGALYRFGPSREQAKWVWLTPGTVLSVVATAIVSFVFSWYVSSVSDYNATYGSLGALIGLLTWVWLSVTIVIIGGELNSEVEHQTARDSTIGPEKPIGERGAFMADTIGGKWGQADHGGTDPDGEIVEYEPPRRPISLTTLTLALPAALILNYAKKRANKKS